MTLEEVRKLMIIWGKVSREVREMGREAHGLPEREEDDEFDGEDFDEGFVLGNVEPDLHVELDEAVHGDGDAETFDTRDLYMLASHIRQS